MASEETVKQVVKTLFLAPLANKPKPIPGQDEIGMIGELFRIFYLTLQDVPDDLLQAATLQHLASEKWFPAVADLRSAAVGLMERAADIPDAYTAWKQVKRALRGGPEPHPLATKAIDALGGLREYGQSQIEDEGQWRARFIAAYQTYQKRQVDDAMMLPQIAGYIEKRRELYGDSVAGLIANTARQLAA